MVDRRSELALDQENQAAIRALLMLTAIPSHLAGSAPGCDSSQSRDSGMRGTAHVASFGGDNLLLACRRSL